MRRLLLLVCCLLSFSLLGSMDHSAIPDFQSLYEGYADAVREMNVDAYMGYYADGFRLAADNGQEWSRAELAATQRELAPALHVNDFHVEVQSATPMPSGEYDVVVLQEFDRDQRAGSASVNLRSRVVRHEIWAQTDSGWKIVRIENVLDGPVARRLRHWL